MYAIYIQQAIGLIAKLKLGVKFTLPDLFGKAWNNIPKADRLGFGKEFKKQVDAGNIPNVKPIGKKSNNLRQYERI